MKPVTVFFAMLTTLVSATSVALADNADSHDEGKISAAAFEASLHFQDGEIALPNGMATLKLGKDFRYLPPADAERVLVEAWGNPPGNETLGMVFPAHAGPTAKDAWGVVITYDNDGHVADTDANDINYDDLLKEMQDSIKATNESRMQAGYGAMQLVGWAEKPYYDAKANKLFWAKEIEFDGDTNHTLNYNVRVLGKGGVLVMNAVSAMNQLPIIKNDMRTLLADTEFNQGNRYADFNPSVDKVAAYGLAALVAGGIAAKTGLLAKLLVLILAFKKIILLAIAGIGGVIWKFFKRK